MPTRKKSVDTVKIMTPKEEEVPATIWARIWANKLAKEAILIIVAAAATQLVFGFTDLVNLIDRAQTWQELLTSFRGWFSAFSFALVITVVKQTIAWASAKLAGTNL